MMERNAFKNIHNDAAKAAASGLTRPVGSGMMSISFLNQMLIRAFGDRWTHGGSLEVSFIRPIGGGDSITANGIVTEVRSSAGELDVDLEIWCENQDADRVAVGKATVRVPHAAPHGRPAAS
jgi:acyl dehydratase